MKINYGKIVLGAAFIIAVILMMASCIFVAGTHQHDEDCIEEPVLTRDYEEVPSTQCVTCSLIIPNEIYGEHIKTCCP